MIAPTAPPVNHLLFADDTLLLFKANAEEATLVGSLLDKYAAATGQLLNPTK